ncbi:MULTISPECIES: hypothetical protein [Paraburkholderia]|nr:MULTISPECIES: hypothetical protein [Paraburkholderia]
MKNVMKKNALGRKVGRNAQPRQDSLMDIDVTTYRAPANAARTIGKISC